MSNQTFPTLPGLDISVERTQEFRTTTHETVSGREQRTTWWSTPRYSYHLKLNVIRDNQDASGNTTAVAASGSEAGSVLKFLSDHYGSFDSFNFTDPYDGSTQRVRFKEDSLTVRRIAADHWECEFGLVGVK